MELKLYKSASGELAVALNIAREEVAKYISDRLQSATE